MKTMIRTLSLIVALSLVAAACGDDGEPSPSAPEPTPPPSTSPSATTAVPVTAEFTRADAPRATSTDVTSDELALLVGGNTELAFDLFHLAAAGGENALISPYSIAAALTMTYAGARGETASEMRDVLHLGLSDDRVHAARNELDLRITAEPPPIPDDERAPFTIRVANSLWGQQGYPFIEDFLTLLAANYDAGMNLVDFATAADEARVTINTWVEDQTAGRIVDLIPEGVITGLTRLVLVNAIWFKANWAVQFDPSRTIDGPFTTLEDVTVTVPLMSGGAKMAYASGDGYQAARLPYAGDASMLVVVPDQGRFDEISSALGPELLSQISSAMSVHQLELTMPRFEFRTQLALKPALKDLGMTAAFTPPSQAGGADLTGMTQQRELYVSEVVHQAFIKVDEEGTEAAAATAVIVSATSASPPATLAIDRPFLFLIQHGSTNEIIFIGQVTDPS
jgi:serpin B